MRLIKLRVGDFRRLAMQEEVSDESTGEKGWVWPEIDLDGDLVCIVGPNAAGKSSLLDAVRKLDSDDSFREEDGTRVRGENAEQPNVEGRFVLDERDLDALKEVPQAKDVRQVLVSKRDTGREYVLIPRPDTDLEPRRKIGERALKLQESGWASDSSEAEGAVGLEPPDQTLNLLANAIRVLDSEQEEVLGEDVNHLAKLRDRLATVIAGNHVATELDAPQKRFNRLVEDLDKQISLENLGSTVNQAVAVLKGRVPRILKFVDDARELEAIYDLTDADARTLAIDNLLALAETDWDKLAGVAARDDPGDKMSWIEDANDALEKAITENWGGIPLTVKFFIDANRLRITMEMESKDYIPIDAQSDGLRQFVALRAFIAREKSIRPIVLIDEAETHLHYDAQADLVTVFEEQDEASQIVYTTHSAGCLPRDIGVGIRAITPIREERNGRIVDTDHSEIINKFWAADRGFSPLLIAMGASAFAFSAAQRAMVTEGMSDAILLPTLMREVLKMDRLAFQVVPSFAEAHPEDVPGLDLLASRVAYAADGDDGGERHVQKLKDNEVLEEQIVYLGGPKSGVSLEDLLVKDRYLDAVNAELDRWHPGIRYPRADLPDTGRSAAVKKWCADQKGNDGTPIVLSKTAIAQQVLDQRWDRDQDPRKRRALVAPARVDDVKALHTDVEEILEKATQHLREEVEASGT